MSNVINIDERAQSFKPLEVSFRGENYLLGGTALELFGAASLYRSSDQQEGEDNTHFALRLLGPMLGALCPAIGEVLAEKPLTASEELAFMPVVLEVVKRIGAIRFREADGE